MRGHTCRTSRCPRPRGGWPPSRRRTRRGTSRGLRSRCGSRDPSSARDRAAPAPSRGCTARPTPKIGAVAFEPSLPFRPPQPPTIQSYHMKIGRPSWRPSRPPTSRYSRLNAAGERPLGPQLRPELEDRVHDLLVRAGAEPGHRDRPRRVHDRPLRPQVDLDGAVEAGIERDVREERLRPGDHAGEGRAESGVDEAADRRV